MSNDPNRIEIITGHERRRRYTANEKIALVDAAMRPGMTVSAVARLHGVSPSLLFKWRQLMSQGGQVAVKADEDVVAASKARELEQRVRELERLLGRKTMEVEVLKEALAIAREKSPSGSCRRRHGTLPGEGRRRHARRRQIQSR
jgi:transposase